MYICRYVLCMYMHSNYVCVCMYVCIMDICMYILLCNIMYYVYYVHWVSVLNVDAIMQVISGWLHNEGIRAYVERFFVLWVLFLLGIVYFQKPSCNFGFFWSAIHLLESFCCRHVATQILYRYEGITIIIFSLHHWYTQTCPSLLPS
jgi:hypothetical protein